MDLPYQAGRPMYKGFLQPNASYLSRLPTGPECAEPACSSSDLTAQCTDQCVVIACNDPSHPESICAGGVTDAHCDLVCDEAIACTDCHGFDAFLQCCDDRLHVSRVVPPNISWDASFEEFWCACNQYQVAGSTKTSVSPERTTYIYPENQLPSSRVSDISFDKTIDQLQHNPFHLNGVMPPGSHSLQKPPLLSSCLWDSCHGTFQTISDLVKHVNDHILDSSPLSAENNQSQQHNTHTPIPCLWGDCDSSLLKDSGLLTYHLINDHLGVAPLFPQHQHSESPSRVLPPSAPSSPRNLQDPCAPPLDDPQMNSTPPKPPLDDTQINSTPPESPLSTHVSTASIHHSCTGVHDCQWKDCGQSFQSCDQLTSHINTVHIGSGKAHYDCFWDKCSRNGVQGFQSKQKICRHVQSHTGHRPFQCRICQQNFSEAATLQQHIRRHTQEKPYACDHPGCGKAFAITGALTIHKRTHNGDKPFKCTYCERGFAESSNLSKHLRTHTGARPYTCTEPGCDKSFARPDQLNRHKVVHKKQQRSVKRTD